MSETSISNTKHMPMRNNKLKTFRMKRTWKIKSEKKEKKTINCGKGDNYLHFTICNLVIEILKYCTHYPYSHQLQLTAMWAVNEMNKVSLNVLHAPIRYSNVTTCLSSNFSSSFLLLFLFSFSLYHFFIFFLPEVRR